MIPSMTSLETLGRLHGEELSRISHALRTPLTSIVGFADALVSDTSLETGERTEFARIIKEEGEKLSKFVDELLYLSFATSEPATPQSVDLATLVSLGFHTVEVDADRRSINLEYEILSEERRALLDNVFATTMLVNVLHNALRYAVEGTTVLVQAHRSKGILTFHVHSQRARLMQIRPNMPSQARFYALGLARTNNLINLNGGTLSFLQNEFGDTTVTMQLPTND